MGFVEGKSCHAGNNVNDFKWNSLINNNSKKQTEVMNSTKMFLSAINIKFFSSHFQP